MFHFSFKSLICQKVEGFMKISCSSPSVYTENQLLLSAVGFQRTDSLSFLALHSEYLHRPSNE